MSGRDVALGAASGSIALVLAQDAFPGWAGFHTWQYAAALAIGAIATAGYAFGAARGEDGPRGRRLVVAMAGAIVVTAAGIASGLLGPDTEIVSRAPGTVAPLPDAGAAAFFPVAGAAEIARGDARIVLRRRGGAALDIGPGERRFLEATALSVTSRDVAYVEARDLRGNRLTITQPSNAAFLSPVLFFPQQVPIANAVLPADAFATPAARRQIKAFFVSKAASSVGQAHGMAGKTAVLFAVDDEAGRLVPGGIGFAVSGRETLLGGLRLRPTIGTYPELVVAAVPFPLALLLGGLLFLGGLAFGFGPGAPARGAGRDLEAARMAQ